ncbi:pyridoxamine 5'-phosphate oxidase family protein, partial [Streptomyces sp. NPDC002690]
MAATQRRGRRIMLSEEERDAYLTERRTCRVATVGGGGGRGRGGGGGGGGGGPG